jgi:SAM-dependent methyltransferase
LLVENALGGEQKETKRSFSAKWKKIPSYGSNPAVREFQVQWYLERFGWKFESNLRKFLKSRNRVLEAGTGTGALIETYLRHLNGIYFGLDISPAVDPVFEVHGHHKRFHIVQADLRRAPFPEGFFDFIVSDQVLHHTPNTEKSFKSLVRHLAPGGQIAAYVYIKKGAIRELIDDFIRERTTHMSANKCYQFSRAITHLGKALSEAKAEIILPEPIPVLGIPAGRHDVQRLIYWHFLKCFWNDAFDFHTNVMINFDWYHPLNAFRHTPDEVKRWVREAGLKMIHFDVGPSGISFRAQKPQ